MTEYDFVTFEKEIKLYKWKKIIADGANLQEVVKRDGKENLKT